MISLNPTTKTGKLMYSFLLVILICVIMAFFIITPTPKKEIIATDALVTEQEHLLQRFQQEIEEHKVNTVYRTTVIRDAVQYEVSNLDPDGLALAALQEIEIYQNSLKERRN